MPPLKGAGPEGEPLDMNNDHSLGTEKFWSDFYSVFSSIVSQLTEGKARVYSTCADEFQQRTTVNIAQQCEGFRRNGRVCSMAK